MKTPLTRICSSIRFGRVHGGALAITLAFAMVAGNAFAQLQTAGTVFVNIDATTLSAGVLANSNIVNSGSLGGVFDANTSMVVAPGLGVNGLVMGGTNYMRLLTTHAGALIPPPQGLIGSNATCSIEAWVINPQVAADECIISWGARTAGQ